jgi:hypothetical protein
MPWIQDHLIAVLELIPTCLEPGDEVPNFHRLKLRMAMIERQHFVLSLQEWIEKNAHWLGIEGLSLICGRSVADDPLALTFFQASREHLACTECNKEERETQVSGLIDLLDLHASSLNQSFVGLAVEDLNHIRWDPQRFRQVLAFKISDAVADPYAWLGRHSATRQAKLLSDATPSVNQRPPRPRL